MPFGLSFTDPLKYTGRKIAAVPTVENPRRPLTTDRSFPLQTLWRVEKNPLTGSEGEEWILVKFETNGDATWQQLALSAAGGDLDTLSGDSGTSPIVPDGAGNIAVLGNATQGVSTTGGLNQLTVTVQDATTAVKGVAKFNSDDFTVSSGEVSLSASSLVLKLEGDGGGAIGPNGSGIIFVKGKSGSGLSTSGAGNTITINPPSTSVNTWVEVTTTSQALAGGTGYVMNNASLVTGTLPAACDFGDVIRVCGKGAGKWKIAQNAGQKIHFIDATTTTGPGGSLAATKQYDVIEILCTVANTEFTVQDVVGNITIV
jgi:hypothetical protein